MLGRTRVNDPFNTMGTPAARPGGRQLPPGAATRDKDRRLSSWLKVKRADAPSTQACGTCKGTGSSGWKNGKGETIACTACGGFGY
jgi:hypothetical protein